MFRVLGLSLGLAITSAANPNVHTLAPISHGGSGYQVTGTLTTDGTIGNLSAANFTSWSIHLDDGAGTVITLDETNSTLGTNGVEASQTGLELDGSHPNQWGTEGLEVFSGDNKLDLEFHLGNNRRSEFMRINGVSSKVEYPNPGTPYVFAFAPDPPFLATIFADPDIIRPSDPTTYVSLADAGRGLRTMFDRRVDDFVEYNAYLFNASFSDGPDVEVQVNPEFGSTASARLAALDYLPAVGQLPRALRTDLQTLWIHQGIEPFGGGNQNLLIHTGQGELYAADGILEETLVHEAVHTSLDGDHGASAGWLAAQAADQRFISNYARDFPAGEDLAETFLTYLAVRYRRDQVSEDYAANVICAVPNRLVYLESLNLTMAPVPEPARLRLRNWSVDPLSRDFSLTWESFPGKSYDIEVSGGLTGWSAQSSAVPWAGPTTSHDGTLPAGPKGFALVRERP